MFPGLSSNTNNRDPVRFISESGIDAIGPDVDAVSSEAHLAVGTQGDDSAISPQEPPRILHFTSDTFPNDPQPAASAEPGSPTDRFILHEELLAPAVRSVGENIRGGHIHEATARTYVDRPALVLRDRQEAILFRHFVQKLAIWASNKTTWTAKDLRLKRLISNNAARPM